MENKISGIQQVMCSFCACIFAVDDSFVNGQRTHCPVCDDMVIAYILTLTVCHNTGESSYVITKN